MASWNSWKLEKHLEEASIFPYSHVQMREWKWVTWLPEQPHPTLSACAVDGPGQEELEVSNNVLRT